jgi:hypothetical protein
LLGGRYSSGTCNRIFFAGATPLSSGTSRQRELISWQDHPQCSEAMLRGNAPRQGGARRGRYASSTMQLTCAHLGKLFSA